MSIPTKPYLQRLTLRPDEDVELDAHPFDIPAVRDVERMRFHPDVTFFVGENGSGKSTVLEALAVALGYSGEGGTKNVRFQTTAEAVSPLHRALRLIRGARKPADGYFLRAESFFNVATYMAEIGDFGSYGDATLHEQSHGEAFMALLIHKLRGRGLYLFDEPEAALSPTRQLAALRAIHMLVEDDSQLIIATHSPILLAYPRARIYGFGESGIAEVAYEDTEHYAVTRDFLTNYPRRLEQLFADDDASQQP